MRANLTTADGTSQEDYDFELSLEEAKYGYLGFAGQNLKMTGTGKLGETEFTWELPVNMFRLELEMVPEEKEDILKLNRKAEMPQVKQFLVEYGDVTFGNPIGADEAELKNTLKERVREGVLRTYDEIWEGDLDKISNLPVESFLPLLVLRHIGSLAQQTQMTQEWFEYGFDPEIVYEQYRPKSNKKSELLKPIDSYFAEPEDGEDSHLFSLIIDENAFNSFILDFVLIEKTFSLRDFLKMDPRGHEVLQAMTTDTLALILPQLVEEYGQGKNFDMMLSLSHALIADKLDGARVSGLQMDKNGNFRLTLNVAA